VPARQRRATCTHLQKLIRAHLKETVGHVKTLEKVFRLFGERPRAKKCEATIGLLKEGEEIALSNKGWPVVNAALISVAQKLEHYEIATYGCLRGWARLLGNTEAADLLQAILVVEKAANHELSELARSRSNIEALRECESTDGCDEDKGIKSKNGQRGVRPARTSRAYRMAVSSR